MPDPDDAPWTSSTPNTEVIAAFVKALRDMEDVPVDSKVEAGPMRYKYASLPRVLDEVRPKLAEHGLVLTQIPTTDVGVFTTVFHESGQWISFPPLHIEPAGRTPQNVGSAISYARRYAILSICNLATEDDDGRAATVSATPTAAEDPVSGRVDTVLARLTGLDDDQRAEVKAWAAEDGRKLSGKSLFEDREWLSMVESYLDVVDSDREQP
jgi:hypothetical protein